MLEHLYLGGPAPAEYVEMTLCREFGVLPSRLREEPAENVTDLLAMMAAENKVKRQRQRAQQARRKR